MMWSYPFIAMTNLSRSVIHFWITSRGRSLGGLACRDQLAIVPQLATEYGVLGGLVVLGFMRVSTLYLRGKHERSRGTRLKFIGWKGTLAQGHFVLQFFIIYFFCIFYLITLSKSPQFTFVLCLLFCKQLCVVLSVCFVLHIFV